MTPRNQFATSRHFDYATTPVRVAGTLWTSALALFVGIPLVLLIFGITSGEDPRELLSMLAAVFRDVWQEARGAVIMLLTITMTGLLAWLRIRERVRRAKLVIDPEGISCQPPGIGWRVLFHDPAAHAWRLPWERISSVAWVPPPAGTALQPVALLQRRLRIRTELGDGHELLPYMWLERGVPDHRVSVNDIVGRTGLMTRRVPRKKVEKWLHESPLLKALEDRGITLEEQPDDSLAGRALAAVRGGFDLTQHKGLLAQVVLFFGAAGYAVVDGLFLTPYMPLEPLPAGPFMAAGVATALLVASLGRDAPKLERAALGILCMIAVMAATWPGLLRYNAATADEVVLIDYRVAQPGVLQPEQARTPTADLRGYQLDDYWQHAGDESIPLRLVRGDAGIWQLDREHFFARTRTFYQQRNEP